MNGLLKAARRTDGPKRPITVAQVLLFFALGIAVFYAYAVNHDISGFLCDVNDVAARGACSGFDAFIGWQAAPVVAGMGMLATLCLVRIPLLVLVVAALASDISTSMVLGMRASVVFMEITAYTRDVSFFNERDGIAANGAVLLGFLGFLGLLAYRGRND